MRMERTPGPLPGMTRWLDLNLLGIHIASLAVYFWFT